MQTYTEKKAGGDGGEKQEREIGRERMKKKGEGKNLQLHITAN